MRLIPSLTPFAQQVLDRYETRAPVALSVRVALEHTFAAAEIDAIFEKTREAQYDRTLHFSTVVDVMAAVVTQTMPSVNAGLVALGKALPVTRTAFYNKLNNTETPIAAALVDHSARKARALIEATGGTCAAVLPGYRPKIVDDAHLAHTERRLSVLWGCAAGPLPGLCLVVMESDVMLVTAVIPCEDGHAQERSLTTSPLFVETYRAAYEPALLAARRSMSTLAVEADGLSARAFEEVARWAPILGVRAYRQSVLIQLAFDQMRRGLLDSPSAPSLRQYWERVHLLSHLTLLGVLPEPRGWLSKMAQSFSWQNWTPSFPLVRERTLHLAVRGAWASARFGTSLVEPYLETLGNGPLLRAFDGVLGLVSIALLSPESDAGDRGPSVPPGVGVRNRPLGAILRLG